MLLIFLLHIMLQVSYTIQSQAKICLHIQTQYTISVVIDDSALDGTSNILSVPACAGRGETERVAFLI